MKKYIVSIPIAGAIHVEVEAVSEGDAKDAAWEKISDEGESAGDLEWEFHEKIVSGNVCHVSLSEIEVNEVRS